MDKESWLSALRAALAGLPEADITRSADYYTELIEDGMEDGQSEFEAVSALPDPEEAARQILPSRMASTGATSSGTVTLRLSRGLSTMMTRPPACSMSMASSVPEKPSSRARA